MSGLSIVIPVYNEYKNLSFLVNEIFRFVRVDKFEIIIVDDNSKDGSHEILRKLKKRFKNFRFFIRKKKPRDLSRSCVFGFKKAKFEFVMVMDGDLQHDPKDINKLYKKIVKDNCDIVVGSRELLSKKNYGLKFYRLIRSIILILFVNVILGKKTNDPMSGFFVFRKKVFTDVEKDLFNKGYKILLDLIYTQKRYIKIKDVFIKFQIRKEGSSKMNFNIIYLLFLHIFKKLRKFNFLNT